MGNPLAPAAEGAGGGVSDVQNEIDVLGILAWAVVNGVKLPFSVGLVEGQTHVGTGWPHRFDRDQLGNLRMVNCGSLDAVVAMPSGEYLISAGGGTMTFVPVGFVGDAP